MKLLNIILLSLVLIFLLEVLYELTNGKKICIFLLTITSNGANIYIFFLHIYAREYL